MFQTFNQVNLLSTFWNLTEIKWISYLYKRSIKSIRQCWFVYRSQICFVFLSFIIIFFFVFTTGLNSYLDCFLESLNLCIEQNVKSAQYLFFFESDLIYEIDFLISEWFTLCLQFFNYPSLKSGKTIINKFKRNN